MTKLGEILNLKEPTTRRVLLITVVFVVGYMLLAVASIQLWQWSNSNQFCANTCHDVHPEEPVAYRDSYHARVKCAECHLGREGTLQRLVLKAGHLRHLPETLLGQYERPVEWEKPLPTSKSCELCHWATADQGDVVKEIRRFLPNKDNTEKRTYLALQIEGGEELQPASELDYIHWHATNRVEYIATDEDKQDIRWVKATLPEGRTVEYDDVADPLSPEEIAAAEKHVMSCVDCHNRAGHPFPPPERLVDNALAEGRLSADLPFVKREAAALLTTSYSSQEEALAAVERWKAQYEAEHRDVATTHSGEIEQAVELVQNLVTRVVFDEPGTTWRSFIDNEGHKYFSGCFRCHDGKHLSSDGESIRLHCNICHSIPETVGGGEGPPELPAGTPPQPSSHLDSNFMADHRFRANEDCARCHGEVTFGSDDTSFCANSACHGQAWPMVNLNAAFPHPIELEGKHAEVWCHDCHEGVKKPEYECANCHEPPTKPHYGQACEECHTPEGWTPSTFDKAAHLFPLSHDGADGECTACHPGGDTSTYYCFTCHSTMSTVNYHEAQGTADILSKCTECHSEGK